MSVYLHDIPLPDAQARLKEGLQSAGLWRVLGEEQIPLDENALGRVLAEPVWACLSSPHYHAAAMDGFSVRAEDTLNASPSVPVTLTAAAQAQYVDTGDPLPAWANAVIPIEYVEALDVNGQPAVLSRQPDRVRIREAITPWSHVRPMGEDIVATELVLPAGQVLRPADLGAMAASGHTQIKVARRPRVAILPTGTELVEIGKPVKAGDIIEYNSIVMAAQIKGWGGEPSRFPITPDQFEQIQQKVRAAASDCDLILLNAGSSAGSEDFSAQVVQALGELWVHGVAVRPGHPVILGMVGTQAQGDSVNKAVNGSRWVPIVGVPGYPVSAALTCEIFVEPLLAVWTGRKPAEPIEVTAAITRKVTSPAGDDDYLRVSVGRVGSRLLAAPIARGAGVITSLVRADGIVILPRGTQGLEAGTPVQVRLYRSPIDLERTIFAIGSHDLTLDLISYYLAARGRRLVSVNAGSQGGLVALRRGEAHLAGAHLLDPETGEYNLSYIRQYLPDTPVVVMEWVKRKQGLLVLPGNPKAIGSLQDLARPGVTFVNRQRGAGTRVLLDYRLKLLGIQSGEIAGYSQEEYTHLAVAAAVRSGRADCGLGIAAAATALGLDFIPLFDERYDLVIPRQHYESPLLAPLKDLTHNEAFKQDISALQGYNTTHMGRIVAELS